MPRCLILLVPLSLACSSASTTRAAPPAVPAPPAADAAAVPAPPDDAGGPTDLTIVTGDAASVDASRPPPAAVPGATVCLQADGPGGVDTYDLIHGVLGPDAIDDYADTLHTPPVRHVREEVDDVVGAHFLVVAHRDIDLDHLKDDRQRTEITIHAGGNEGLKGKAGETIVYAWRFRLAPDLKSSNAFSIFFQIKSEGGNASAPIVALTAHGDALEIHQVGNDGASHTVAGTSFSGARGLWLAASARATFSHEGSFQMTVARPDGTVLLSANLPRADMWRDGDFTKPKWGIYRSLTDKGHLNASEDSVGFTDIGITVGGGAPTSDCRTPPHGGGLHSVPGRSVEPF